MGEKRSGSKHRGKDKGSFLPEGSRECVPHTLASSCASISLPLPPSLTGRSFRLMDEPAIEYLAMARAALCRLPCRPPPEGRERPPAKEPPAGSSLPPWSREGRRERVKGGAGGSHAGCRRLRAERP